MSSNKNSDKKSGSKRSSPSRRTDAMEPDGDRVPELIDLSDDNETVENARRGWRDTRRSRSDRLHGNDTDNSASAVGRNSHYNTIDGDDEPPPLLDDDDDFVEMPPVAATRTSHGHGRHGARSARTRDSGRNAREGMPQGSVVFMNMFGGSRPTHYCHQCRRSVSIDPSLVAIECPECHGSFVEEISTNAFEMEHEPHRHGAPGENDDDADDEDNDHGMGNFGNFIASIVGGAARGRRRGDSSSGSRRSASAGGGGHFIRIGSSGPGGAVLGGEHGGLPQMQMEFNGEMDIAQFMQQVIGAMTGRGGGGPGGVGNLLGGDYVFSNEGFDQVMTQLLEQLGTMGGVPPLNQEALDKIPTTAPPQAVMDANENCIICFEPYNVDDECKKLPCEHLFHVACISKWLTIHGTCPICRDDLSKKFPNSGSAAGGGNSSSTEKTAAGGGGSSTTTSGSAGAATAQQHSTGTSAANPSPFENFQFRPFQGSSAVFVADSNGNFRAVRPQEQQQSTAPTDSFSTLSPNNNSSTSEQHSESSPLMRFAGGLFRTIRGAMTGDHHNHGGGGGASNSDSHENSNNASSTSSSHAPPPSSSIYPPLPTRSPATGFDVNMPLPNNAAADRPPPDDARRRAADAAAARAAGVDYPSLGVDVGVVRGESPASDADAQSGKRHKAGQDGNGTSDDGKKLQYDELD